MRLFYQSWAIPNRLEMNATTLALDKYLQQSRQSDKSDIQLGYLSYFKQLRWESQGKFRIVY